MNLTAIALPPNYYWYKLWPAVSTNDGEIRNPDPKAYDLFNYGNYINIHPSALKGLISVFSTFSLPSTPFFIFIRTSSLVGSNE